ncbi:MAG: hypothetical protein K0U74_09075 [Alphaproteobacteria bacterium]|nr:hypothetical protein [Alphaproteobacteria bacterium]
MTHFYKTVFAAFASLLALCAFSGTSNATPLKAATAVDTTQAAQNALIVNVTKRYKRRRYSRRYSRRYRGRYVTAPYTYVDSYRGDVEVDAPYAYVRRSRRGVRVRAPYVDLYIPR